jgi:glycosyltransferase involved in cell wall biosynthesis
VPVKQKILHIIYSGLGGTSAYVFNLIIADKSNIYTHEILFYGIEDIPTAQYEKAKLLAHSVYFIKKTQGIDIKSRKAVLALLKKETPNVITLHVNSIIVECSLYKQAKLIFVEHQSNQLKTKKEWVWSVIAQLKADFVVSLSRSYNSEIKKHTRLFYQKNKNKIIKTGIDLDVYQSTYPRNNDKLKIGVVSRINSFRDHETLLKAFNSIEGGDLYIAGDGPLKHSLEAKYTSKNIHWLGLLNENEVIKLLSELDIFVMASFGETNSIALMQAQASKLPIIACNVNGINNILSNKSCVYVEPENIDDYRTAIKKLLADKNKRQELSEASYDFALQNLSNKGMFKAYIQLFEQ